MRKLVILGGGYGGLSLASHLLDQGIPGDVEILLIDRMPYQGLKTEYYALAAGTIPETEIRVAYPDDPRLRVVYGEVTGVDLPRRQVLLDRQEPLHYDWLALALGCVDKYHGIEGADVHTHSIQTLSSSRKAYAALQGLQPYGQVTIVGGGLSGVELASELRESRADLNIRILDRGASILSAFPDKLQSYVREWFVEHGVEMVPHIGLTRVEPGVLHHQEGRFLTDVTVWTAGIQPSPIVQRLELAKDPLGRLIINEYHQLPVHPEVYVIGDCASLPFSPSAQLAQQQAAQVGEVLQAMWKGSTTVMMKPIKLKGVLGSLGKASGFGVMGAKTVMFGKVPRLLKSGVLWMSKRNKG